MVRLDTDGMSSSKDSDNGSSEDENPERGSTSRLGRSSSDECGVVAEVVARCELGRKESEGMLALKVGRLEIEKKNLEETLKDLHKKVAAHEKVLEEQQNIIECPVCLQMPREGFVSYCPNGHFVCSQCFDQMKQRGRKDCPKCRAPMQEGKSLLALTVVEQTGQECRLQGCSEMIPVDNIQQHEEEECSWRLVICPGPESCKEMIPFKMVEDHVEKCPYCWWPPMNHGRAGVRLVYNVTDQDDLLWRTNTMKGRWTNFFQDIEEEQLFFCRVAKKNRIYIVEVVMKRSKEECKKYLVEVSMLSASTGKSVFKTQFLPRPMVGVNQPDHCLRVSEERMSEVIGTSAVKNFKFEFAFHLKITKVVGKRGCNLC